MTAPYQRSSVEGALASNDVRLARLESNSPIAHYEIKVVSDIDGLTVGAGQFIFAIPYSIDGWHLVTASGYVTTVGSTTTEVTIFNLNAPPGDEEMLQLTILIPAGEYNSLGNTLANASVNPYQSVVATMDRISIDVLVAGTGAMGLGVILEFKP